MVKKKWLNKKQIAVIDDLCSGEFNESQVLSRHKVSRNIYSKWRKDENFTEELERQIAWMKRQSELIITRYMALAAAKLVELTESEKEETARKACLDIISLPAKSSKNDQSDVKNQPQAEIEPLSTEAAEHILSALANGKNKN